MSTEVIFVLGSSRSGTSALTRVLALCGCRLPESVLAPRELNPTGFWEPVEAIRLNYDFLFRHRNAYVEQMVRLQTKIDCDEIEKEEFVSNIQRFLTSCHRGVVLIIKELVATEFMDLWLEGARREGFSPRVVIAIRHPREVFASWTAEAERTNSAEQPNLDLMNVQWLARNLIAESTTRGLPRVFVEYSNLVTDWRSEVARMSHALRIKFDSDQMAIDRFLTKTLYRQRCRELEAETLGSSWTSQVYSILSAAARDVPLDLAPLEEIRNAFRTSEHVSNLLRTEFATKLDSKQFFEEYDRWPVWKSGHEY